MPYQYWHERMAIVVKEMVHVGFSSPPHSIDIYFDLFHLSPRGLCYKNACTDHVFFFLTILRSSIKLLFIEKDAQFA